MEYSFIVAPASICPNGVDTWLIIIVVNGFRPDILSKDNFLFSLFLLLKVSTKLPTKELIKTEKID